MVPHFARLEIWEKIEHCFVRPILINFTLQIISSLYEGCAKSPLVMSERGMLDHRLDEIGPQGRAQSEGWHNLFISGFPDNLFYQGIATNCENDTCFQNELV